MARIGYARVSTTDQNLAIQLDRLTAAGCSIIRSEKLSGKSREGRTELETVMQFLRDGDELCVVRLDRLGRSTRDVLNIVHDLDEKGAMLRVLEPELTTGGDIGRIVVTVLGMVAEMERKFILERQRAGIDAAKLVGVYKGRKKSAPNDEIRRRKAAGERITDIARFLKVSRMTVYRALASGEGAVATVGTGLGSMVPRDNVAKTDAHGDASADAQVRTEAAPAVNGKAAVDRDRH